ncbi:flagellar basal body-associated FliL family protein [Chelatococcus daeguensis]|uniref:flagellar basal body-associated FliL family protein n=1 Tax=Chelatococcus daeguensis TaxID=444444 RepID=UPI000AF65D94|nr:flagellar basal body-associated FliL family protein [Chelatococcus daeguensis]
MARAPLLKKRKKEAGGGERWLPALVMLTLIALGVGSLSGIHLANTVKRLANAEKEAAQGTPRPLKYSGNTVIKTLEPVVANLSEPADVWVRLETSIIFDNGTIENPDVMSGEIRQDMMAYVKTLTLAQIEGPSGLQHLREDLNERARVRADGRVRELLIETMIVQ